MFTVHVHRMLFKAHHVEKFYVRVWTEVNPLLLTWRFNQKESKKKKEKEKGNVNFAFDCNVNFAFDCSSHMCEYETV